MIDLRLLKILKKQLFVLAIMISCYALPCLLVGQDSIRVEDLKEFSYPFDIEDGVLIGKGAQILSKAIANAHITMLGNNSRKRQESDLDLALSKLLNKNGYKTMVMEVGPASAQIAHQISQDRPHIVEAFKKLNQEYYFEIGKSLLTPIPDLKYTSTAQMIKFTEEHDWSFVGIGTDSWTSYKLIIDELYKNLPMAHQQLLLKEYQISVELLDRLYNEMDGQSYDDLRVLTNGINASNDLNKFLDKAGAFDVNKKMVESLQFSIDYWSLFGNKDFYSKNKLDSDRNKILMKRALDDLDFDFNSNKMFLKLWRGHLAKGRAQNGFYGVGNMLMELAEYHGNTSLNIAVLYRYTMDDGKLIDVMDNPEQVSSMHQPFVTLGQKNEWVLVDLRPFIKEIYLGNYIQTMDMEKMISMYDMVIIPKTDSEATVNF